MVRNVYKDILPPGSITAPYHRGIKNTEYSATGRRIVNEWWYSQLRNKENFYDILKILIPKNHGLGVGGDLSRIIQGIREYLDGEVDKTRKTFKTQLGIKDDETNVGLESAMNKSILLATVYETIQEMSYEVFETPYAYAISNNRFWKPIYGAYQSIIKHDGSVKIPQTNVRNRKYTQEGGRDNNGMVSWWNHKDAENASRWRPGDAYGGSIDYFMNPPLGSIVVFLTHKSIRFNFMVSSTYTIGNVPMINQWSWNGITLNADFNNAKKLTPTQWVTNLSTVRTNSWYASDPFWSCDESGFVEHEHFVISFLDGNGSATFSNQFINWPLNSPSI